MFGRSSSRFAATLSLLALLLPAASQADSDRIRVAQPRGLQYLANYVVLDRHMIEERASAAGLGSVRTSLTTLASESACADAVLADDADLAMGGFVSALTTWDKTFNDQQVRAVLPVAAAPIFLVSTDPNIPGLAKITAKDRIAVVSRTSDAAIGLQMAAALAWGRDQRTRLDPMMTPMTERDAANALIQGLGDLRLHASVVPWATSEMDAGKAHVVISSEDVGVTRASNALLFTTKRFHDDNPKLYPLVAQAYEDALIWIASHPREAAEIYVSHESWKGGASWIEKIVRDPERIRFSSVPRGISEHAEFLQLLGLLKNKPTGWKDVFWENVSAKDGS
jgi:NitT/TauT family transport system substrate-binding protein